MLTESRLPSRSAQSVVSRFGERGTRRAAASFVWPGVAKQVAELESEGLQDLVGATACTVMEEDPGVGALVNRERRSPVVVRWAAGDPAPLTASHVL
jgi:hypothetical protein